MKYFILLYTAAFFLFPMSVKAQTQKKYNTQWTKVTAAEKKGLPRTAWNMAKKIYTQAAKQGDEQQQIKALIYQLKYRDAIEENALLKNMLEVDSMAAAAAGVPEALLQNLAANLYLAYVHRNRYRLQRRSTSTAEKKETPATWSLPHFYLHIDSLFQRSLQHKDTLKHLAVKDYLVLIDTGKNSVALRPTVFDILAHDALKFYTSQTSFLELPASHFIIDDPAMLAPAPAFSTLHFPSTDSLSPTLKALKLYRELIRFHLNDDSADALIDIDLQRIKYVFQEGVMTDKDSLYRQAIRHIISRYAIPAKYKATALLAQWYYNKGIRYDLHDNPHHRWALKKALDLCKKVPDDVVNKGSVQCERIKDNILRATIGLQVEKVNIPGKPFRALISYKNQEELWFKIVKLDDDPKTIYNHEITPGLLSEKDTVATWQQEFPLPEDYQEHSAEMKVGALPPGRYALIASANPHFQNDAKPVVYVDFHVSNLSYVTDNNDGILVLNRESGKPVKNAKVRLWKRSYSTSKRKYVIEEIGKYKTSTNGYVKINHKESAYVMPEISSDDDHLFVSKGKYFPYVRSTSPEEKESKIKGSLFTDRSIYRPGQRLYFKGILYQDQPGNKNTVVENKKVKVFLFDTNYQIIDSLLLASNEYGSFAGTFQLPSALLNGRMHIAIDSVNANEFFRVEEYKRPTFDMTWDSVAMTYQLGDTVAVAGTIMGYNGVPIGDAAVKYQVTRKRYLIPYYRGYTYSRSMVLYPVREAVISQGTIKSGSTGQFSFTFPAIPDEEVPEGKRIFNYEVTVDVTDINGESHHYSYTLPIGDQSLLLHLGMKKKINNEELDSLYLTSTDLSGRFVSVPVAVSLYALKAPARFIRDRYWSQPDQYLMDKKKFLSFFPHDEYKNEADIKSWAVSHAVYVSTDTTRKEGRLSFHYENILPGWYLIKVMAKDKYGHFVTDSQYIQIYKTEDKTLPFRQVLWTSTNEINTKPGKETAWQIGSSEKAFVFEQTESPDQPGTLNDFRLSYRIREEQFEADHSDRGGVIKHYVAVRYNRIFTEDVKIHIPWENKRLHITYETFRNKILPGEKETWTVKITGKDQQKVNAELLASMYDVSLDYFTPHRWNGFDDLYPSNNDNIDWEGRETFSSTSGTMLYQREPKTYPEFSVVYPHLKNFGYHWNRRFIRLAGRSLNDKVVVGYASQQNKRQSITGSVETEAAPAPEKAPAQKPVAIRTDFRETAFFYPQLHTDDSGNVSFTFTALEALTRWKLMLLAHTTDLKFALSQRETVTQKPLMIQLNAPRFVRQGDQLVLSAKVSNLSDEVQSGNAVLHFKNTITGKTISIVDADNKRSFTIKPGQSIALTWPVAVPKDFTDALTYVVKAFSEDYSDGEQNILPVLSNKTRITESLPLHFSGNGTHQLHWEALSKLHQNDSDIQPESMTIEYTGNPIWYAVQALPFLDEEIRKSADALFRKIYANALSRYIALKIPHFKDIMQQWLTADTSALKSPLQKNQELKNILLKETPWVENAQTEAAQKSKIAHWYADKEEQLRLKASVIALQDMQLSNGGFSWFKNMPDSRLITQEIITGLGHLKSLHAWPHIASSDLKQIVSKAIPYLDARMKENFNTIKKHDKLESDIRPINVQYLYMRSFFPDIAMNDTVRNAYNYFYEKATKEWAKQNTYNKAMLALTFHRKDQSALAHAVLRSLKETAIQDKNTGMHWKQARHSYFWYQAPIATQAICLEAFSTLQAGEDTLNALRTWLLDQKQTRFWGTGKATAHAVYALLLTGTDWAASHPVINIRLGDTTIVFGADDNGLQYEKIVIPGGSIQPDMDNIQVSISGAAEDQPSWGAAYLQYFADMNKVDKGKDNDLHIERQISLETSTSLGKHLSPISEATALQVGDKVQVRLIIKADRDMDFVHLKDVRASCMEPLQVLSGFHWNEGTGYYSTVSDAAVHFYFQHMPKGTYVLTYPVYITQKGNFTGGLSQIECLYAPKIRAHSEGVSLQIK